MKKYCPESGKQNRIKSQNAKEKLNLFWSEEANAGHNDRNKLLIRSFTIKRVLRKEHGSVTSRHFGRSLSYTTIDQPTDQPSE